jgi:hypothetical protein
MAGLKELSPSSRRFIKPKHIPAGIAESGRDFGRIRTDRLNNLTSVSNHGINGRRDAAAPNVDQQRRSARGRPADDPSATYSTGRIVKRNSSIATLAKAPTKHLLIEFGRATDVASRNLNITDFPVRVFLGHIVPFVAYNSSHKYETL